MPDTLGGPEVRLTSPASLGARADLTDLARLARPRDFRQRQRNPVRRFGGIALVVVLHVALIYALVNGLATRVVKIVTQPIEARIVEPVKPPPPPPPKPVTRVVSQPKLRPPPAPFVPPPEVHVRATPPQPVITHQDVSAPSEPVRAAPPAPTPPAPPAPVARPVSREVGVVCPNSDEVRNAIAYPEDAQNNDVTGNVTIEFTVDTDGHIVNERVASSAGDASLDRAAFNAVRRFHCVGQSQPARVRVPFVFDLK